MWRSDRAIAEGIVGVVESTRSAYQEATRAAGGFEEIAPFERRCATAKICEGQRPDTGTLGPATPETGEGTGASEQGRCVDFSRKNNLWRAVNYEFREVS
jgi:hypothetical protein